MCSTNQYSHSTVNLLIPSYILSHISCNKCLNHNNLEICKLHLNYHCDGTRAETSGQQVSCLFWLSWIGQIKSHHHALSNIFLLININRVLGAILLKYKAFILVGFQARVEKGTRFRKLGCCMIDMTQYIHAFNYFLLC